MDKNDPTTAKIDPQSETGDGDRVAKIRTAALHLAAAEARVADVKDRHEKATKAFGVASDAYQAATQRVLLIEQRLKQAARDGDEEAIQRLSEAAYAAACESRRVWVALDEKRQEQTAATKAQTAADLELKNAESAARVAVWSDARPSIGSPGRPGFRSGRVGQRS